MRWRQKPAFLTRLRPNYGTNVGSNKGTVVLLLVPLSLWLISQNLSPKPAILPSFVRLFWLRCYNLLLFTLDDFSCLASSEIQCFYKLLTLQTFRSVRWEKYSQAQKGKRNRDQSLKVCPFLRCFLFVKTNPKLGTEESI